MTIGERVKKIRLFQGMTQKQLGMAVGLGEKGGKRIAQYEIDYRIPKAALLSQIAGALGVSPDALSAPNWKTPAELMYTLFAMEDQFEFHIDILDGELCLVLPITPEDDMQLREALKRWYRMWVAYRQGEISKIHYDQWRYTFT